MKFSYYINIIDASFYTRRSFLILVLILIPIIVLHIFIHIIIIYLFFLLYCTRIIFFPSFKYATFFTPGSVCCCIQFPSFAVYKRVAITSFVTSYLVILSFTIKCFESFVWNMLSENKLNFISYPEANVALSWFFFFSLLDFTCHLFKQILVLLFWLGFLLFCFVFF